MIDALLAENLLETSQPVDNFGWTLLHRAVYENNIQLVEVLLKHGKHKSCIQILAKSGSVFSSSVKILIIHWQKQ